MFHKLLLILGLEVTGFTVERLLLLGALSRGVRAFKLILLRCFGTSGGVWLNALGQVFSLVLLAVLPRGRDRGSGAWRVGVLDDAELSAVLVVEAVPDGKHTRVTAALPSPAVNQL